MKLQLALDTLTLEEGLALVRAVEPYLDRLEMGTPFLLEYGMEAVRQFRRAFPEKEILADTKIMDAGALEAESAFRAGADLITVMALADRDTVQGCLRAARQAEGRVIADLLCVEDLSGTVRDLTELGVHGAAVHVGVDQQARGRTPLRDLAALADWAGKTELSVAGGISRATLPDYCARKPDVLIVGGAIANAVDPAGEAKAIWETIQKFS